MDAVEHLIMCVAEEAGEVAQIAGKCGRFGLRDHHPKTDNVMNFLLLRQEYNELRASIEMLFDEAGIGEELFDREAGDAKKIRIAKYMRYAGECGTLQGWPEPKGGTK